MALCVYENIKTTEYVRSGPYSQQSNLEIREDFRAYIQPSSFCFLLLRKKNENKIKNMDIEQTVLKFNSVVLIKAITTAPLCTKWQLRKKLWPMISMEATYIIVSPLFIEESFVVLKQYLNKNLVKKIEVLSQPNLKYFTQCWIKQEVKCKINKSWQKSIFPLHAFYSKR